MEWGNGIYKASSKMVYRSLLGNNRDEWLSSADLYFFMYLLFFGSELKKINQIACPKEARAKFWKNGFLTISQILHLSLEGPEGARGGNSIDNTGSSLEHDADMNTTTMMKAHFKQFWGKSQRKCIEISQVFRFQEKASVRHPLPPLDAVLLGMEIDSRSE